MPVLGLFSWSQFTIPAGIPEANLTSDTHPNDRDPNNPSYDPDNPVTWIGETFTFTGSGPTQIVINDDEGSFDDGYVDSGTAQTLAQDVTIDGTLYPAGSTVENEFSLISATGQEVYVVRINGENVGFAYGEGEEPSPGETFTAESGLDGAPSDNADGTSSSSEPYTEIMCFAAGTLIDTPDGPRAVECLRAGDLVSSVDRGAVEILWRCETQHTIDSAAQDGHPVLISAGALGPGLPRRDLIVSPQHRILVGSAQLGAHFDAEALAPAKSLTWVRGIRQMRGKRDITWSHFACATHEVIRANGCLTESLLLGPMVLNGLSDVRRWEVHAIFGPHRSGASALNGPSARRLLRSQEVMLALQRNRVMA